MSRSPVTGKRYPCAFPGDSDDKRAARGRVFSYARDAPQWSHALALPSFERVELTLMRDYLHWPGSRVHFVDWAREAQTRSRVLKNLAWIKRNWREADVVRGDVNHVIDELPHLGLAVLDFMGFNRESVMPCVKRATGKLVPGGVMAVTSFRGRDIDKQHRSAWDVFEAARDIEDFSDRRWAGMLRLPLRWARELGVRLELLETIEYHNKNSPMAVTIWRRSWE